MLVAAIPCKALYTTGIAIMFSTNTIMNEIILLLEKVYPGRFKIYYPKIDNAGNTTFQITIYNKNKLDNPNIKEN